LAVGELAAESQQQIDDVAQTVFHPPRGSPQRAKTALLRRLQLGERIVDGGERGAVRRLEPLKGLGDLRGIGRRDPRESRHQVLGDIELHGRPSGITLGESALQHLAK
jgi:hypothetical protein